MIIWIIILVFWSIAQYLQKSRAAQRRPPQAPQPGQPPPTPTRPRTRMDRELEDLLRELTGQPPVEELEEEPEAPVRPPPTPVRAPPPRIHPTLASSRAAAQTPAPGRRAMPEAQLPPLPALAPSATDISEGMAAAFAHSGKMPGLTLRMKGLNLKSVRMQSHSGSSSRGGKPTFHLASLRNPTTLRHAVIARMVLDKPKALESTPAF